MQPALFSRTQTFRGLDSRESGVTMVLVAVAMVAIVAMAALSIDVITLYLAREESQRSADAAALAAARILSVSGITGDPSNSSARWTGVCGGSSSTASQAAQAVGMQNSVAGPAPTVNVTYGGGNGSSISANADCTQLASTAFGVNPLVTVQIKQTSLPTFFSRVWGTSGNTVSATATAEAFNSSNSGNTGNESTGAVIPVQPRCVKPWIVPNLDPQNPNTSCTNNGTCQKFVDLNDGHIINPGISLGGGNPTTGVVGETFWLAPDCVHNSSPCLLRQNPPAANYYPNGSGYYELPPSLQYLPGQTLNSSLAVPGCAVSSSLYENAIEGCDQTTVYQCGVQNANTVDLSENPGVATGDTMDGVQCLIHQGDTGTTNASTGQDYLNPYGAPTPYPFQILAGSSNPLVASSLNRGSAISASNSIVSLPIYDSTNPARINNSGTTSVTIVGFLQVFINAADQVGNVSVTVLNVSGCGTNATGNPVNGTSPVPVRLITPP